MKKVTMKLLVVLLMCVVLVGTYSSFAEDLVTTYAVDIVENIQSQMEADVLVWRYKVENSLLYMRLYNSTTNEWIGDWILY